MTGRMRRRGSLLLFLSVLAWLGLRARAAAADEVCPPASGAWLRVGFDGAGFTPALRARVLEQMAADLGAHGVVPCAAPAEGAPLGDIRLELTPPAALSLELRDEVTQKRVARTLSLRQVPPDARGLSIALAAEELLHASWIEAALAPPPPPAPPPVPQPAPPAVVRANEVIVAQLPRTAWTHVALMGAAAHATGGDTALGPELRLAWGGRLTFGVRAGVRIAPDVESAHGVVRERQLLVGAAGAYALAARESPWGGELVVRIDALVAQLSGIAAPGALAASGSALGVVPSAGLGGWMRLGGAWRALVEATAGAPLHGITASDSGQTATGLTGAIVGVALGVGASL